MPFKLGISLRVTSNDKYPEIRDALSQDWPAYFSRFFPEKIVLVPLLNHQEIAVKTMASLALDGLLLSGGNDLNQCPERDMAEKYMLEYALEKSLPVLGVCRGLQMINRFFQGQVEQNIDHFALECHVASEHDVELTDQAFENIADTRQLRVNSYHDQGVLLKGLAKELKAFALAGNDIVEGLYHSGYPLAAVQWHPERLALGRSQQFDSSLISGLFLEGKIFSTREQS